MRSGSRVSHYCDEWPGGADDVRVALKIGSTAELRLDRLDADTMVEIISRSAFTDRTGCFGPSARRPQAGRGSPRRSLTCASRAMFGTSSAGSPWSTSLPEVLGQIMNIDTQGLLAPFALGGSAGVRQDAVAERLSMSRYDLSSHLAKLGAAGIIRERARGVISIEPDPMRWILVKRVFYERPGTLEVAPFLDVVEDRQDALDTMIGARSRGAAIPDLERWLEGMNSSKLWEAYTSLGAGRGAIRPQQTSRAHPGDCTAGSARCSGDGDTHVARSDGARQWSLPRVVTSPLG